MSGATAFSLIISTDENVSFVGKSSSEEKKSGWLKYIGKGGTTI